MCPDFSMSDFIEEFVKLERNVDTIVLTLLLWFMETHIVRIVLSGYENRIKQFLLLARPYYIYFIVISLINLLYGETSGRFYTVLVAINSIFISFCISILNPFNLFSSRFPALEAMTNFRFVLFALFQLLTFVSMAFLHLLWCYLVSYSTLLDNRNENFSLKGLPKLIQRIRSFTEKVGQPNNSYQINTQPQVEIINQEAEKYKHIRKFCTYVGVVPSNLLLYTGVIQLVARIIQACQNNCLYEDEKQTSEWGVRKLVRRIQKAQQRSDIAVTKLIKQRHNLNY